MEIGHMTERITILKPKVQAGAVVSLKDEDKWEKYRQSWAKVEYLKGQEYFEAMATNTSTILRFIIWYCRDIDTTMAIQYQNKIYNITTVNPLDYAKTWLIINAKEVSPSV